MANIGDIVFIGYNGLTSVEGFAFVVKKALTGGDIIKFTDNAILNSSPNSFRTGEYAIQWTVPNAGVAAGTVVVITNWNNSATISFNDGSGGSITTPSVVGTLTLGIESQGNGGLNNSGDQIFAYTGTLSSPTILAGLDASISPLTSGSPNAQTTYAPAAGVPFTDLGAVNAKTVFTTNPAAQSIEALTNPSNFTTNTTSTGFTFTDIITDNEIVISEVHPAGSGNGTYAADWFELTNNGTNAIDITGWRMDDNSNSFANSVALNGVTSIAPGQSVVFIEGDASTVNAFKTAWFGGNLPSGFTIGTYSGSGVGLGNSGDQVNIFDGSGNRITGVAFAAANSTSTFDNKDGLSTVSTSSTVGVNGAFVSSNGAETGSPGTIANNNNTNSAPVITVNTSATTDFLDGGTLNLLPTLGAGAISGVINDPTINDPTDPARTLGIDFTLSDPDTPVNNLTVTVTSSNQAVVPNANLTLTGTGADRNLKINPTGVGLTNITVTVSDGTLSSSYIINYAASAGSVNPSTRFLTGTSDASTAIAIDANYMFVADDEDQTIRLYDRNNSGLPVASFDFTSFLGLSGSSEVDIEASTKLGNTIYWMGSHSNNSSGNDRPNRERIFATQISGTGANTSLSFQGYYQFLEDDLIAWDNNNGHNLGAGYLGLAVSAAAGVLPEQSNAFNIEGLTIAPDGTTAYVAFRAPNLPTTNRTQALIIPVTNFTSILNGSGGTLGAATFGTPIQLDLGGRGIRSIERNASNQYIIIAGPAGAATGTAPNDFRLYTWTGNAADAPVLLSADLTALNAGGSFESIVEVPNSLTNSSQISVLVDNGDTVWYNDGTISKDLAQDNLQKFRSEVITLGGSANISITKIHEIQGSGSTFNSAFGGTQTIEGIVVAAFPGTSGLRGFYVQEEDADADANSATSEGIFVFDPSGLFSGNVGDKVRVTGNVAEFTSGTSSSLTQLSNITSVVNFGANTLPTVTNISLPVTSVSDLERYEGMFVNVSAASGNLTVTEYFQLGRFGQVLLSATGASNQPGTDARLDQYTQFNAPSVSGYSAYLADIAKRQIYLDDGSSTQNPSTIIFGRGGQPLSASNTLRGGDTVSSITGILDQRFEGYRIQTTDGVNFTPANPRPISAPDVGSTATLKVASFNVLNYFNGDGLGGGFPTARGADNPTEFTRQRDKIIQAIIGTGADILGLNELENDGYGSTSAIQDLVNGLNAVAGAGTYTFINPGTSLGTDQIAVGLIYKPGKVSPVGAAATMPNGYGTGAFDVVGRKPLAQTFQQISTGESFTAVVNHFKSKGSSSGGVGDADAGDGQGFSNGTRTRQAQDLAQWLATNPTGTNDSDYLILGDLNAYAKEDPLTTLAQAGYNNLLSQTDYSFVFRGQVGSLDHALASTSLAAQVTGAEKWHINADEPNVLDYNTNFKSAIQETNLYNADPYRSSDHDPVIIGLNLYSIDNTFTPAPSRDPITGSSGNDVIVGGAGAKTITGGAGNDQFVYTSLNDVGHRIADFEVGTDKIVLTQLLDSLVSGGYNGSDAITDGYIRLIQGSTANSTLLQIDRDGALGSAIFRTFLTINNVAPAAMNDIHNFVF
jgi:predicted extracellular nuclease